MSTGSTTRAATSGECASRRLEPHRVALLVFALLPAAAGCSSGASGNRRDAGADAGAGGDGDADADADAGGRADAGSGADAGEPPASDAGAACDAGPSVDDCPGHCAVFARCECTPCDAECACDVGLLSPAYVAAVVACLARVDCDSLRDAYDRCREQALAALEPTDLAAGLIEECEARSVEGVECDLACPPIAVLGDETLGAFAHCWSEPSCQEIYDCLDPIDTLCG